MNGWSVRTISRPIGSRETGISLKLAMPSGMPMIVTHSARPVTMWPMASHQPARISHRTLPMQEGAPASRRSTAVYPKGHRAYTPMRKAAMPNGMPMIVTQSSAPATT